VFGISAQEFVVLAIVAAVVLGPERLPVYAQQLGRLIRELRRMAQGASAQVRSEMGPEFDDIDWRKFDPRQYDPRRIVREALADSFDPDDPLGLKELDKPMSPGGPGDDDWGSAEPDPRDAGRGAGTDVNGANGANPETAGNGSTRGSAGDRAGAPPFDADAT
jgi:sec-independent protein translocase protein TatB